MASLAEMAAQSNQIAQQNNPNFAALNTLVQGRTIPLNGFSDFLQKTIEPAKQRRHEASENLLNRQHTSSENLLNRQHQSAENEQNRRHNLDLENLRNKLAKDLENYRHNNNKELVNLRHDNDLVLNDRNQKDMLERLILQHRLGLDDKDYDAKRQDELHSRQLKEQYAGSGGLDDPTQMDDIELQRRLYTLNRPQTNTQTTPALDFSKVSDGSSPESTLPKQPSILDLPTYNKSGSVTVDNLLKIGQLYPYLYETPKGRDFMDRVVQTYNNNPDNRLALVPLLKEIQSGKIPLMAPIKEADRTPYPELQTPSEETNAKINMSWKNLGPIGRIGSYFAEGSPEAANVAKNAAMKYGYAPEREIARNYNGLLGAAKKWLHNKEIVEKANNYIEQFKPIYKYLQQKNMKRVNISPNDQVNQQARIIIANMLGLSSPFDVQVFRGNYGPLTFVADGQMFEVGENGEVFKVEP